MKSNVIITCLICVFTMAAHAQTIDLASGITDNSNQASLPQSEMELKKDDKQVADDRGIFSFLNFSFIKKAAPAKEQTTDNETSTTKETSKIEETPLQKLHRQADEGNLNAQLSLGYMYLYGTDGVESDYQKSFKYYEMAANQNDKIALNNLGSLYFSGIGTERDYFKAAQMFAKAAELGSDDAAVNLAFIYLSSDNQENMTSAVKLFEQAANAGNNTARFMLGYAYYKGFKVPQDYHKAVELMKISANSQLDEAQYILGLMYMNGLGIAKNYGNAVNYFKNAANQGNIDAMMQLADILAEGTMYPKNLLQAHIYYNIASVYGAKDAAGKRDALEKSLKIEEILPAQSAAEKFKERPSELTTYVRQTFGKNIRRYIDENMK